MKSTILAISAHNDDHLIGAGGALTKYAKEGKRFFTIICSYGEQSHPHLERGVIIKKRVTESLKADKIMGGSGVAYLNIQEGKFIEGLSNPKVVKEVKKIIAREKPEKIFTHDLDAHPDHRAVHDFVMRLCDDGTIKCPVYSFDIWSLFKMKNRNVPRLVVDISGTFTKKVKAFLAHESQKVAITVLIWKMVLKDWLSGLVNGTQFAEVFYRLR